MSADVRTRDNVICSVIFSSYSKQTLTSGIWIFITFMIFTLEMFYGHNRRFRNIDYKMLKYVFTS